MHSGGFSKPHDEDSERFCAHLSSALHAMAQPLTILRSSVAASIAPGVTPQQHERYLGISVQQVERACGLFRSLQDLVVAHQVEANASPMDMGKIVSKAVATQKGLSEAVGISVMFVDGENLPQAIGDEGRSTQALVAALKVAVALSATDDTVEVLLKVQDRRVECSVQNQMAHGKNLDSSQQLMLALAETNMRSQKGDFELASDPFRVTFTLPAASEGQ